MSEPQHSFDPERVPKVDFSPVLTGQKALVTGGSSGIGRAIAIGMARGGADVAVNYASGEDRAAAVVDEIEAVGRKAIAVRADVSDEAQITAMFAQFQQELGALDILVNNAGLQRDAPFPDMSLDDWNAVISVNLTGQFLCAREAVKLFLAQGVRPQVSLAAGKIIHISSVHEVIPWAGHVNYAASKGGVKLLMQSLAQELAPQRIRVNSIAPGAVRTPINTDAWQTPEAYSSLMELVPYRRIGEPEDIAHAAVWLASDAADYVNAATIFVDGGMAAYPGFIEGG